MKQFAFWAFLVLFGFLAACKNDSKKVVAEAEKAADSTANSAGKTVEIATPAAADTANSTTEKAEEKPVPPPPPPPKIVENAAQKPAKSPAPRSKSGLDPAKWADVAALDPSIKIDIRYATADNFTKSKIYDCPACYLRPEAAAAIVSAQKALKKQGLGLKMFDCYRPRPYQQRLWDKVPNPNYVTPPEKGSMHSRGAAVDLTLVDAAGKALDMGTEYDFFGPEAHSDCTKLPAAVLENRRKLTAALKAVGFEGIRTEWWHFSFKKGKYELASEVWDCPK